MSGGRIPEILAGTKILSQPYTSQQFAESSRIEAKVKPNGMLWIEDLVEILENAASSPVFAVLKRPDEKWVTEKAYENPSSVEDIVRDLALALDNDDLRRGRPTLHRAFGEAMAILAGDALLNLAYGQTPPGRAGALASRILHDAVAAMIAGQVLDTIPASRNPSLRGVDSVRAVHERKTGALIKASVMLGGLAGLSALNPDPSESDLDPFSRFGAAVGLMFQIVDDLLDVLGDSAHVGKATGKDAAAGKLTYPSVLGVEGSRREVERLGEEATAALARMPGDVSGLKNLCNALVHRTK